MKKNLIAVAIAAAAAFSALTANVSADVIVEPTNDFYWNSPEKCEYIHWRSYTVNKQSVVYLTPKASENPSEHLGSLKKGDVTRVGFSYTDKDGTVWACCTMPDGQDGWIYMDRLDVIYDAYSFLEEHRDEMRDYNGEIDMYIPEERVVIWEYPFSEKHWIFEAESWYTAEDYPYIDGVADKCWTDPNGNTWVYNDCFSSKKYDRVDNSWVFLPNLETDDRNDLNRAYEEIFYYAPENYAANIGITLMEEPIDERTLEAYENAVQSIMQAEAEENYTVPVILALSAAALSAVMIAVIGKKKEN